MAKKHVNPSKKRHTSFRPSLELLEDRLAPAALITVNSILDSNTRDSALTLREAILVNNRILAVSSLTALEQAQVNGTPTSTDTDTIGFNIPGSGVQRISVGSSGLGALPTITAPVVLDGATQPDFSGRPVIELNGASAGAAAKGIFITAGNSQIRSLIINGFDGGGIVLQSGGGNTVQGNRIGTNADGTAALSNGLSGVHISSENNLIGGTAAGAGNLISGNGFRGVLVTGSMATGNRIEGNRIGTNADGAAAVFGNFADGIRIESANNIVGGSAAGAGNLITGSNNGVTIIGSSATGNRVEGNRIGTNADGAAVLRNDYGVFVSNQAGVFITAANNIVGGTASGAGNQISGHVFGVVISDSAATGNRVEGNRIGTNADGTAALGNENVGVFISSASNVVGGTVPGAGNLISGNYYGVVVTGDSSTGNRIEGNRIGTNADGTAAVGNEVGVLIDSANNVVGGTASGAGNLISGNYGTGVEIDNSRATGNAIRGNSIYANGGLGIDLLDPNSGVTSNDTGDADTGPNYFQNYPVLTSVTSSGGNTTIQGALDSKPGTTYTLEFFANAAADPSGFGEGQTFLGTSTVTTDAGGNASFTVSLPVSVPASQFISATATDPNGNTSEFSQNRVVISPNSAPSANAGGSYTVAEGGSVSLAGSGTDPESGPLSYAWDLDNNGTFETPGQNVTFSAAGLDGPSFRTVVLRVTDNGGLAATSSATINVLNVAPSVLISGPAAGVRGQTLSYTGSFSDPGTADTHTLAWEVRDGSNALVASGSGTSVIFTPAVEGGYSVQLIVTDDDGVAGMASKSVTVDLVAIQDDPCHPGETALAIGGTEANDQLIVSPGASAGQISITLNGVLLGTSFAPTGRILVYGQAGNDDIQVAGGIGLSAWLDGGAGDDRLKGGAGHDVLLGGAGDDLLVGGSGRDLLIGGLGRDRLVGNGDDDVLIAGTTLYDLDAATLCAVMAEWTRDDVDYQTRVDRLHDTATGGANGSVLLNDASVFDDGCEDVLTGSAGSDWFLFNQDGDGGVADKATDLGAEEFAADIDFINSDG